MAFNFKLLTFWGVLATLSFTIGCSSTSEDDEDQCHYYSSCNKIESSIECKIEVHLNPKNGQTVQVNLYNGDVETGTLFKSVNTTLSSQYFYTSCGQDISGQALYKYTNKNNEEIILAPIDGGSVSASSEKDCDGNTCYSTSFSELDLYLEADPSLLPEGAQ